MTRLNSMFFSAIVIVAFVGCEQKQVSVLADAQVATDDIVVTQTTAVVAVQEEEEAKPSKAAGLMDMANKILEQQAESGSDNAKKAQEWMSDKFGEANDSGTQVADDAAKWASDAFDSLKDKGMTSAGSASEWLTEDIRNINALKYKVVRVSMDDLEAVEEQLNKLGQLRWDCFHAVERAGDTILFFKKERRSLLKNIPVRDMLKLVPLMGQE